MAKAYTLLWKDLTQHISLDGPEIFRQRDAFARSVKDFRLTEPLPKEGLSAYTYKVLVQLEDFLKRYRFEDDLYSEKELDIRTLEKFEKVQLRVAASTRPDSPLITRLLGEARRIAKSILGDAPSVQSLYDRVCYGKRADVGCPASDAYLDEKFSRTHTGSLEHIAVHKNFLETDEVYMDYVKRVPEKAIQYELCDYLQLILVDKSWKIKRPINPNTRVGAWFTNAISSYMEEKLNDVNLPIRKLQQRHRRLVKRASVNRELTTADLTAASSSIAIWLLTSILPYSWIKLLKLGRIKNYVVHNRKSQFGEFMGMGIGFTFPCQMVVFYSLLKAIANVLKVPGLISVYGDDLIYPTGIHTMVAHIFPKLGLILNEDKTYDQRHFRESCGSDYYRGVDVRPFNIEGKHQYLTRIRYLEFCYKLINGLKRRWDDSEIESTLAFLHGEVTRFGGDLLQVPFSFPDTAGIKVKRPKKRTPEMPWSRIWWDEVKHQMCFPVLRQTAPRRSVKCVFPYYWATLQENGRLSMSVRETIRGLTVINGPIEKWTVSALTPRLKWVKTQESVRSKISGRRFKRREPQEPRKGYTHIQDQTGHTSQWI